MAKTRCEKLWEEIDKAVENQYKFRNDKNLLKFWKNAELGLRNKMLNMSVKDAREIVE